LWLLMRDDASTPPRVRAVADHLAALFTRDRAVLEG
jgi:hypothetical protein